MKEMTKNEAAGILRRQLFSPAGKVDIPLVDECLMILDREYQAGAAADGDALWARIRTHLQETSRRSAAPRRALAVALIAALVLALLGVAYAVFARNIFNFYFDAGWPKSRGTVQDSAYRLLGNNLLHLRLSHTDVDVLEAVYDGHELRVVYSLWWRDATETYPPIEITKTIRGRTITAIDTSCFAADGIAPECDWLAVNGTDVFFSDVWQAMGNKPGQVLFYLQTNLFDYDVEISDTLTIGLPLIKVPVTREDGTEAEVYKPTAKTTFTLPVIREKGLYFKAVPMEPQTVGGFPMRAAKGYFSPVSGFLRIEITDVSNEMDPDNYDEIFAVSKFASGWRERGVLCDMNFVPLGITQLESWGQRRNGDGLPESFSIFSLTPPNAWPEQMQFVLMDENGSPVPGMALVFFIVPDDK